MSTREVQYSSYQRISCAGCIPANVILCVPAEAIDQSNYEDAGLTKTTIEAQLTDLEVVKATCSTGKKYKYTFEYDDSLLVDGRILACQDIQGVVCRGCLTKYIDEQVGFIAHSTVVEYSGAKAFNLIALPNGTVNDIDIEVTNPTPRILRGMIHWAWMLEVSGNTEIEAGANSRIWVDGVDQGADSQGSLYEKTVPGGIDFHRIGNSGFYPLDIAPNTTVTIRMRITSVMPGDPPASSYIVTQAQVGFQGTTV